ncbi:hypothetical protein [Streptomyces diastaticus]
MWNWMRVEIRPEDGGIFPTIGEGDFTRDDAHGYVLDMLNAMAAFNPALGDTAARWKRGAADDTVYAGLYTWTIYSYEGDPTKGATVWLDDYADIMRSTGMDINVHWPKN